MRAIPWIRIRSLQLRMVQAGLLSLAGILGSTFLLAGCGSGDSAPPMTITPGVISLPFEGTQTFTAGVTYSRDQRVLWSVREGAAGGSISTTGVYTAPAATGTYHVVATSAVRSSWTTTATVTVSQSTPSPTPAPVSVTVTPSAPTLSINASQAFTAGVANATDQTVTWSLQEGAAGGTITAAGLYTAPATPGTYHVIATSTADTSKAGTATIRVQAGTGAVTIQ